MDQENILSRAWRVSTYTGAVNSDPDLYNHLFVKSPLSLSAIKAEVLQCIGDYEMSSDSKGNLNRFYDERRWDIPQGMVKKWLEGKIIGSTLDRGNIVPWECLLNSNFDQSFYHVIWREQVAGLYPLLMEISYFTSEIVSDVMGERWKELAPNSNSLESEPAVILDTFRMNDISHLPVNVFKLLKKLRITRNKLAHIKPVDLNEIEQIWSLFQSTGGVMIG